MQELAIGTALEKTAQHSHAVLSWVDDDGYPMSVAAGFDADVAAGTLSVGPVAAETLPADGRQVNVTFSHIRPQPGMGYDERRYVNIWGACRAKAGRATIEIDRAGGWDEQEMPFFEYCERTVPRGRRYFSDENQRPVLGLGWLFFLATRLPFLTATIVPVALGAAVAWVHGGSFDWGLFGITMGGACALHLGLNVANDVFDDASGADQANVTPTPFSGGSRVIQYGLVSRRTMVALAVVMYAIGIGVGIYLAETRGRWLYVIGGIGVAISLAYTGPPLRLVSRGVGEAAVALGFGPVTTLGAYYVLTGHFSWEAFYACLPVAILIALVLYVNEIPDRLGDEAAGKRTLVVRWPKERVLAAYTASIATAYGLVVAGVAAGGLPAWTLLALATAPMALKIRRQLGEYYDSPYGLMAAMQSNIGLHLFTGLLLITGYVLERAV
ncbi:MAG: prenyltransferase [Actinomycetota bacterium]